ncbi:MAG TPA: hypothetical protein VKZ41_05995 [Gemmatimonadales bacterium]|nr:hypothetical protein [Gemmatimonadales bacterium]
MTRETPSSDAAYRPSYYYRRKISPAEALPAIGAGLGTGLAVFYIARLFLQRTPLLAAPPREAATPRRNRLPG